MKFLCNFNYFGHDYSLTLEGNSEAAVFYRACYHIAKTAQTSLRRVMNHFAGTTRYEITEMEEKEEN